MVKEKKAQVTIFIILGLVLLLSMGIFIYYSSTAEETVVIPEEIDQTTLTAFVQSCLDATTEEVIEKVAAQGGMYKPVFYKTVEGNNISYWCTGEGEEQCVNTAFLKKDLAEQIVEGVKQELPKCLDFRSFEQQGYTIQKGIFEGTAIITETGIDLSITYPIKMKKKDQEATVENFRVQQDTEIGMLYNVARLIINTEASGHSFDIVDYAINHTDIIMTKEKPYPSIIYSIQKKENNLVLKIAIQGIDTAATPGEILLANTETAYGCCYAGAENTCYANTPSTICSQKNGKYETAPCSCSEEEEQEQTDEQETRCQGGDCNSCGTRKHGESWCAYEKNGGEGKDLVGSRYSVNYCLDGEIYEEACRDYREEICVEGEIAQNGKWQTKALCRPNRWQDCVACTTEQCCENTEERDCYWNEELELFGQDSTQCTPYVPPGLKFWDFNGLEICSRGNAEKTCTGLYCSQAWVDAAAISCYNQGDCGNYRNTEGALTETGFFISNYKYDPDEEIYNLEKSTNAITALPLQVRDQKTLLSTPVTEAADTFTEMLTAAYRFVNQWVDVTVPNYLNPFTKKPKIEVLELSWCSVWSAPKGAADCEKCDDKGLCSEYRCKSLGRKCVYEEKDGYSLCYEAPKERQQQFTARIATEKMQSYIAEQKTFTIEEKNYSGYRITPELKPYTIFSLPLETTTETICHLDYTPRAEYLDPPVLVMGTQEYAQEHAITVRVPPQIITPQKLKDGLNLTTAEQIVKAITEPETLLESYKEKFSAVFSVYNTVTGNDLADELEPHVDSMLSFIDDVEESYPFYENMSITLLDKFEHGGYYLFISCEDKYGNLQDNELFVEVDISNTTDDDTPPVIVATTPETGSSVSADATTVPLYVYTDEPADCHYDTEDILYEEMDYAFSCKNSVYDRVSIAGGSYLCSTTLPVEEESVTLYIRCADNPGNEQRARITIQVGNTTGIEELYSEAIPEDVVNPIEEYAEYISIEETNESAVIDVTEYLLSETQSTVFNTTKNNVTIHYFTDKRARCSIINETESQEMMCAETALEQQKKGMYDCSVHLSLQNGEENQTTINNYEIKCKNEEQQNNVAEESVYYTLSKTRSLEILSVSPGDNEEVESDAALTVTTSDSVDVQCGYAAYRSLEYVQMEAITETTFAALLTGLGEGYNAVTVYCEDSYGNNVERTVSVYVTDFSEN